MSAPQTISRTVDRLDKSGSPARVLILALVLIGLSVLFSVLPNEMAAPFLIGILAFLALTGVFCIFALTINLIQFSGQSTRNDLTKLMADTSADGILVTSADGQILYANDTYMNMSGAHEPSDIRVVERLFSGTPEVSEAVYRLAQAARERKRGSEEVRLAPSLSGEGAFGWYQLRARPLDRRNGNAITLWTVTETTRERERHENVFQELQHAIDFLDHAPSGFLSVEADGQITYINTTLAGWLDYDLAQVGSGGLVLSDIIAGDGAALITSMTGAAGDVRTQQFDLDLKCRNGKTLPVRLLHRVAYGQDRTPGSSRTLVINRAAGEDREENVRVAEVRFARFFNSTPMAIAIVGENGAIFETNAAFVKLMPLALSGNFEGNQRSVLSAIAERDRDKVLAALKEAGAGKSDIAPIDAALEGAGNRSARLFFSAAENIDGQRRANVFALEMTEQRTLQESFAQSQKMQAIGQLAGGVAHDFNNVLTAIIGYSDLLLNSHRPTDPSFQDIMQIKQNANRAAGLVRQLLAFSRRQTLRPQVIQLSDVLSDVQMLLKRLAGERIELEFRHGRDLWFTKADVNQFEQVIVNLVVNARDAMPQGGKISVRTRNFTPADCASLNETSLIPAEYAAVEVEDNGTGIPDDVKAKIFEPFFTTKEVGKGTGLGLSMVYGIVKQTGGYVFVESTPGKGTIFRILLPRHIPTAGEEEVRKDEAKPVAADHTGHGTVLLVEDEEAVRAFGARALTARGYTVLEAASGLEALERIEEHDGKVDLIVSDVVMPEMDGPTMFGELRKRGIHVRVIFVSGYAEDAFAKNLPEGEDFGFLPKPFSLKQLIETVKANIKS